MLPESRCVVLVPVGGTIDLDCEDALRELERRGYGSIDAARNQMASGVLAQGFDELMWIDSDIVFDPDDVAKLRRHDLPLVCGIYPKKACRQFACAFRPKYANSLSAFGAASPRFSTAAAASSTHAVPYTKPCSTSWNSRCEISVFRRRSCCISRR